MRIIYGSRLAKFLMHGEFKGFTLGSTVRFKQYYIEKIYVLHEAAHVLQYQKYGFIGFLVRYFFLWLKHGYSNHPFEVEAWKLAYNPTQELQELADSARVYPTVYS